MLAAQDTPVIMVLDDLHMLTEPVVLDGLAYVLRNAAPVAPRRSMASDSAVTGYLHNLTQTYAFVRPLGQGLYRYHSMFAAVLRLNSGANARGGCPTCTGGRRCGSGGTGA